MSSANGKVVWTVTGSIPPAELGVTLSHEHLLLDGSCFFELADGDDAEEFAELPMTDDLVPRVRQASCSNRDNLQLDDIELAICEVREFLDLGGHAIVDVTSSVGVGRDPRGLREISQRTGIPIVMGCGFYCEYSHPDFVHESSVDDLTEFILRELREGVDGVRAGIIGEIGINGQERGTLRYLGEMTPDEEKTLRAASRASVATGAAICIHQPNRAAAVPAILQVLAEEHVSADRVILAHMSSVPDFAMHVHALEHGYWVAYDNFGMGHLANAWYRPISDEQRADWLAELFARGFGGQVLISHDVWCKAQLRRFGGGGYGHILRDILPALRKRGLGDDDLEQLLVRNPAAVLAF